MIQPMSSTIHPTSLKSQNQLKKRYLFYISQNYSYAILRPLQKAIKARGEQIAWFLEGEQVEACYLNDDETHLLTVKEVFNYSPDAIFYPANIAPTFLPGINVAIFHGFDAGKLDKRGNNDHFKVRHCFDLYCTQGPNTTKPFVALEKKFKSFKVKETGWCALDELYKKDEVKGNIQILKTKPTILLCSTFSKKLSAAPHLFETVKNLSNTRKWNWLIQFHPKMPIEIIDQYKSIQSDHLTFVETDNIMPLLQEADVMVCDTSSVLMMFLLLNKPVVTFKNISPTDYLIDISEPEKLEQSIEYALNRPEELMQKIVKFIKETHPYNDGKSSDRVLAAVDEILKSGIPLKKKPLNLIRNFKMRKKLGYWR